MPRVIPIARQQDLDRGATTRCKLIRITPLLPEHPAIGLCSTNIDITYDDGAGPLIYRASTGVDLSNIEATSDMGVDNSEATSLLPSFDVDVSDEILGSGAFDYARWQCWDIDYVNPEKGQIDMGSVAGTLI